MIFETTLKKRDELASARDKAVRKQQLTREQLEFAIGNWLIYHSPRVPSADDLGNLTEQGMDAIRAVLQGYPPFRDDRTLATD